MKKLLSSLSAVGALSITGSTVISCGVSLEKLSTRTIDTNTYTYYYPYPLESWSTSVTMQAEDNKYLCDTQSTLVRTNKYDQVTGDLGINSSEMGELDYTQLNDMEKDTGNVGLHNHDYTKWTYFLNPNAMWSDSNGDEQRNIESRDYINAIFNTLCSYTFSETIGVIEMFLDGYDEVVTAINKQLDAGKNPADWNDADSAINLLAKKCMTMGTYTDAATQKTYQTITYNLSQNATYFDTVLTYTAFAPMPDFAIELQLENGKYIPTNKSYYNYGKSYKIPWISGSYYVSDYDPSRAIILKKNENYIHNDLVYIDNLVYNYVGDSSQSKIRMLYESGDIDNVTLSPSDTKGWSKYVGTDAEHPSYDGAYSRIQPDVVTFNLTTNYDNANSGKDKNALAESLAMNSPYIRQYLYYNINRSDFIKYYSQGMDTSADTSSWIRNVYTARNFAINGENQKDYGTYLDEQYATSTHIDSSAAEKLLADGSDAMYRNNTTLSGDETKYSALNSIDSTLSTPSDEAELIVGVKKELKNIESETGVSSINLDFLYNGSLMNDTGTYINKMVDNFNAKTKADGLTDFGIKLDITLDSNTYKTRQQACDYDIIISGWSPDYADPSTFLNTETFDGDLNDYTGYSRMFKLKSDENDKSVTVDGMKLSSSYNDQVYSKLGADSKKLIKETYTIVDNYTKDVQDASKVTDSIDKRYKAFAKAEYDLVYKYNLLFPLYVKNGSYQVSLGYLKPRTSTTVGYGSSQYRHIEVELTDHVLSSKERAIIEEKYQEDMKGFKKA